MTNLRKMLRKDARAAARVLINQSTGACDLGKPLLLRVSGTMVFITGSMRLYRKDVHLTEALSFSFLSVLDSFPNNLSFDNSYIYLSPSLIYQSKITAEDSEGLVVLS